MKKEQSIKVTNTRLLEIWIGLTGMGELKGKSENRVKFGYGVSRNMGFIKPKVEALQEGNKASDEMKKYSTERKALLEKHSNKDKKGRSITNTLPDNRIEYDIYDKDGFPKIEFSKEEKKLTDKFKDAIDANKKQSELFLALLKEEVTIDIYIIKLDHIPEDATPNQIDSIREYIEE